MVVVFVLFGLTGILSSGSMIPLCGGFLKLAPSLGSSLAPSTSKTASTSGAAQLAQAEHSLAVGQGPAAGSTSVTNASPHGRNSAGMAYFGKGGYVLLFGGCKTYSCSTFLGDTWKFENGSWTRLHPKTAPSPRVETNMVYDAKDGYVLLFGGCQTSCGGLADTWEFSNGTWTQLHPTNTPAARGGQGMAYDAKDGYVVMFGGCEPSACLGGGTPGGSDTWTFTAGQWTHLSPKVTPKGRLYPDMAYDAADHYVVMFSGCAGSWPCSTLLNDTWKFTGGQWTLLSTHNTPPGAAWGNLAYDPNGSYLLLFGGLNSAFKSVANETWEFSAGNWTKASPLVSPSKRSAETMVYDSKDGYAVLFGGCTNHENLNDTWTFNSGNWTKV